MTNLAACFFCIKGLKRFKSSSQSILKLISKLKTDNEAINTSMELHLNLKLSQLEDSFSTTFYEIIIRVITQTVQRQSEFKVILKNMH